MLNSQHMAPQTPIRPSRGASRNASVSRMHHILNMFSTKQEVLSPHLHGTAGHDGSTEHGLGPGFDAQNLSTQSDDSRIGGEKAHQGRGKDPQTNAGKGHDTHAKAGAQPGKPLGHILPVGTHGLADDGDGCALDAVARHVAQALGVDSQAVGGNGHGTQAGHDAHHHHLRQRDGGTFSRQRTADPQQVPQAGAGDLPGAGFRMQRGLSRSSRMAKASRPPTTVARAVPRAAPGTPSPGTPDGDAPQRPVGLMRKKLKMASSTQTNTLMRLGGQA